MMRKVAGISGFSCFLFHLLSVQNFKVTSPDASFASEPSFFLTINENSSSIPITSAGNSVIPSLSADAVGYTITSFPAR